MTDSAAQKCQWSGSAPICNPLALAGPAAYYASASCPSDHPDKLTTGKDGAGGEKPCWDSGGFKSLCCSDPVPYTGCAWYQQGHQWADWIFDWIPGSKRCKGECPTGKVPIAADSTGCWFGTTSYFCCDDPNTPPQPVDNNMCPIPPGILLESGQVDDDGDPQDEIEFYGFEDDCFINGDASSWDSGSEWAHDEQKRSLPFGSRYDLAHYELSYAANATDHAFRLQKRGGSRLQSICGPGPVRTAKKNQLRSRPYPTVNRLLKGPIDVISLAKPAICGAAGIVVQQAKTVGQKYVVEHVMELQSVSKFATSLARGILPGGGSFSTGTLPFSIFDVNGAFQSSWASLGVANPAVGSSMEETVYSVLGTSSNLNNFQICEAGLNGLKATIWAGAKNIIAADTWSGMSHQERYKALQEIVNVFDYLNLPGSQDALEASYNGMNTAWRQFGSAVASQTNNYDFTTAFKEWNTAQFQTMVKVATDFITTQIAPEIKYWTNSNGQTVLPVGRAAAAAILADLTSLQGNVAGKVKIATSWIT